MGGSYCSCYLLDGGRESVTVALVATDAEGRRYTDLAVTLGALVLDAEDDPRRSS